MLKYRWTFHFIIFKFHYMEKATPLGGGSATTIVVALVMRPDGTSQVVNFKRDKPLPLDFKLADSDKVSSVENADVPGRLKFFFDKVKPAKAGKSVGGVTANKENKAEEGLSDE